MQCLNSNIVGFVLFTHLLFAQTPEGSASEAKAPSQLAPATQGLLGTQPKASSFLNAAKIATMLKAGLSHNMPVQQFQKENGALAVWPNEMIGIKDAGASGALIKAGAVINAMGEIVTTIPAASPSSRSTVNAAAPRPSGVAAGGAVPTSIPNSASGRKKKRTIALYECDDSAVSTAIEQMFKTRQNVGRSIHALIVKRLVDSGLNVVERAKLQTVMDEQNLGASSRVKQGGSAKIGRIIGADAQVFCDIVAFGRDNRTPNAAGGGVMGSGVGAAAGLIMPGGGLLGSGVGAAARALKKDKAVVTIAYRIVDGETSQILYSGEAKGESVRKSTARSALTGAFGSREGEMAIDITSSNFAETIIGEATIASVDKVAAEIIAHIAALPQKEKLIEARIADVNGPTVTISAGLKDGIEEGDTFEVHRIIKDLKDPVTNETLDLVTERVGELVIQSVRDRISTGMYTGSVPAQVNFAVRSKGN